MSEVASTAPRPRAEGAAKNRQVFIIEYNKADASLIKESIRIGYLSKMQVHREIFVGVVQANIQVPTLETRDYPLTITVGGVKSNAPLVSVSK